MFKSDIKNEVRLNFILIFLKIVFVAAMVITFLDKTK